MVLTNSHLREIDIEIDGPLLESLAPPILREIQRLEKHIVILDNIYPKGFNFRLRAGKNLTDLESLSLVLLTYFHKQGREVFLFWELRLFLLNHLPKRKDALGCLILTSRDYKVARCRLLQLSSQWGIFLLRNFSQNLYSALRKLDIAFTDTKTIVKPQRKRGYNDHGSLTPLDLKAVKAARAYWEDCLLQQQILLSEQKFVDTVALLTGFID